MRATQSFRCRFDCRLRLAGFVALSAPVLAALITGCSGDTLPKYVVLGGLRVLAVRADLSSQFAGPAEFSPGDTVVVTPYVSYYGLAAAPTYQVSACVDPGVAVGAEPSCLGVPGAVSVASGTVALTGGVSNTGQANSFTVTIPATIHSGRRSIDQYNGVNYLVTYTLLSADGSSSVASYKRLPVSLASKPKNQNPSLSSVQGNGSALSKLPAGAIALGVSFPAGARETYSAMKSDGTLESLTEDLTTTYFITDGDLKYYRTINDQTTTYTPPGEAPVDHSAIIVGVLRDPRGGVAVSVVTLAPTIVGF